jgi:alpha-beta hydrolase superfamily lysophospholipase
VMRASIGVVALAAAASAALALPAPAGASPTLPPFYKAPAHIPSTPGSLIKDERITSAGVAGTTYRVMYVSTTLTTRPVAVTGLVVVPKGPAPADGFPVVAWGHGTNGMATQCAPSLALGTTGAKSAFEELNALLAQRWVVVGSDYQGEGTPGPLPYLVGDIAARNTIDLVRAAQHLSAAHAGTNYVVWGHSEGGLTAMYSLHIAASYAPTLHLLGVVAGAPPSQFALMYTFLEKSPFRFYLYMAAIGYEKAYGPKKAPLADVLTPLGVRLASVVTKGCYGHDATAIDRYTMKQLVKKNPFDVPTWRILLQDNDPEYFTAAAPAPLLILQGGTDTQIPVISTQLLAQHLCSVGQDVERWIYPGMTHTGVITVSIGDMVHWIADRFAGVTDPDPYHPVGMPGIETSACP